MSILPPEVTSALGQLLQALQSPDNVARSSAEEQLTTDWVNSRPDVLLMGLVEQLNVSDELTVS
jgi:importin-5